MPVDIRSFFSKKAPPAAANKKNKATKKEGDSNGKQEKYSGSKNTNDKKAAAAAKKQPSPTAAATKKDTTSSPGGKRKQQAASSNNNDNNKNSNVTTTSKTTSKKESPATTKKREVSVADFFASSLAKQKKKQDDPINVYEDDEVRTDDESTSPSPPPHKKRRSSPGSSLQQPKQHIQEDTKKGGEKAEMIDLSKQADTTDDDDYFNTLKAADGMKKSSSKEPEVKKKDDHTTTKRKRVILDDDDDNDDDYKDDESIDHEYEQEEKKKKKATPSKTTTPSRRETSATATAAAAKPTTSASKRTKKTPEKRNTTPTPPRPTLVPELKMPAIDLDTIVAATPECLANKTFVFTGILSESFSRDNAEDLVKTLGGRITGAVSGKTDYLVIGEILEDGRHYTDGSKYKKALAINAVAAATASSSSNSKKKNATTLHQVHLVVGEQALYGLAQQYSNAAAAAGTGGSTAASRTTTNAVMAAPVVQKVEEQQEKPQATTLKRAPPPPSAAAAAAAPTKNPYAAAAAASKPIIANPYARPITNPYAKTSSTSSSGITAVNPYAKKTNLSNNNNVVDDDRKQPAVVAAAATAAVAASVQQAQQAGGLWVDRYKPTSSKDILGNSDAVNKLAKWLSTWEKRFNHPSVAGKTFSNPNGGPWKAALLSGPPGIGKTTTATLVALEAGRDVIEFNASDVRSKKAMHEQMGDITGSQTIQFQSSSGAAGRNNKKSAPKKLRCIVMDEVDGMGAGDRSGVAELIQMIKKTKVPIIAICNDRQNQKLKSLIPYCMDLRYKRPMKTQIATRAMQVAAQEGWNIEKNAAEAIAESCGNDVRQVLNCLQMWASDDSKNDRRMTYKGLKDREKSINKDEVLRIGLFDAARIILEGRRGLALCAADPATERDHFMRRNDAFFVDYNFTGLLVQQNYLKVVQGAFNDAKRANNDKTVEVLERMADAAGSMSDFALAEQTLRVDQNWSVLPFVGALVVKTGYHAGGESGGFIPGFPEFTTWLGRNSTKGKKIRLLHELRHHMNYHISCGTDEMRMSYVPVLRNRFLSLVVSNNNDQQDNLSQAIRLMDDYGLDRDDIFEKLDEFNMNPRDKGFSQIDSKKKAAFTRTYNAGSHTSQVLVAEQGGGAKKMKRKASSSLEETIDPDAIDDDKQVEPDDDEEDDESDGEKLAAAFLKKGKKKAPAAAKKTAKAKPKPRGKKK